MFKRSRILLTAAILVVSATTTACGGGSSDTDSDGRHRITVATLPILYQAPLYLGIKKGFFNDEGLNVKPTIYEGFQPMIAAANTGDIQFGFTSIAPILVAAAAGVPLKILTAGNRIGADDTAPATDELIVPADSTYNSLKDLTGQTVAVSNLHGVQQLAVMSAIDKAGGDSSSTTFLGVPFADVQPALETDRAKVATLTEPYLTSAVGSGMKSISSYFAEGMPNLPLTGYFATSEYVRTSPEIVAAFVKGMEKSTEYAAAHPDEVRAIISQYTQIPAAVAAKVILPEYDSSLSGDDITTTSDLLVKYHFVDSAIAPAAVLN